MIIITGSFRCGSSLMMDCVRTLIGLDNIIGEKFPNRGNLRKQRFRVSAKVTTPAGTEDNEFIVESDKEVKDKSEFNPNGFWENGQYVMRGFGYREKGGLELYNQLSKSPHKAVKILGTGLSNTHPDHVDKIIICTRNPFDLATSQKNLRMKKSSLRPVPDRQIMDYTKISRYISTYPDIPVIVIDYNDHNSNNVMDRLSQFLEVPTAKSPYEPDISKNSQSKTYKGTEWDEALRIYNHISKHEFSKVISDEM